MRLLTRGWDTVVFGTPAVIVFFVISGFCIHLPFIGSETISIGRYYLRRYTRILIPVAGALCVYRLFGQHLIFWGEHSVLWESPLWSLACEEIYYAAYPLLRWLRNRLGWKKFLPAVFVAGGASAAAHPRSLPLAGLGPPGAAPVLPPPVGGGGLHAGHLASTEPTTPTPPHSGCGRSTLLGPAAARGAAAAAERDPPGRASAMGLRSDDLGSHRSR